jgi:hypothetical protein
MSYIKNNLIAIDQLINAILGGSPDETLSAYAWRNQDWRYKFINALFFWQENHCKNAYDAEVTRKQLPSAYRIG